MNNLLSNSVSVKLFPVLFCRLLVCGVLLSPSCFCLFPALFLCTPVFCQLISCVYFLSQVICISSVFSICSPVLFLSLSSVYVPACALSTSLVCTLFSFAIFHQFSDWPLIVFSVFCLCQFCSLDYLLLNARFWFFYLPAWVFCIRVMGT